MRQKSTFYGVGQLLFFAIIIIANCSFCYAVFAELIVIFVYSKLISSFIGFNSFQTCSLITQPILVTSYFSNLISIIHNLEIIKQSIKSFYGPFLSIAPRTQPMFWIASPNNLSPVLTSDALGMTNSVCLQVTLKFLIRILLIWIVLIIILYYPYFLFRVTHVELENNYIYPVLLFTNLLFALVLLCSSFRLGNWSNYIPVL